MSTYFGDFALGQTVRRVWTTNALDASRINLSDAFEAGDIVVLKDGNPTALTSPGLTVSTAIGSRVGVHSVEVDTTQSEYTAGSDYAVLAYPDTETVDGKLVAAVLLEFSIENRFPFMLSAPARSTNAIPVLGIKSRGVLQSCGATSAVLPAASALKDDIANGDILIIEESTGNYISRAITDTTLSTDTVTYDTMVPAPTGARPYWILAGAPASASLKVPATIAEGDIAPAAITEIQTGLATAAALATVDARLDTEIPTILAAVDTELAAIKAKTDALPAAPAAAGDQMAMTSGAQLALVKAIFLAANGGSGFKLVKDVPNSRLVLSMPGEADTYIPAVFAESSPAVESLGA